MFQKTKLDLCKEGLWSFMTELKIMIVYAIMPSIMTLVLRLVRLDYEWILHLVQFSVFLGITYREDADTMRQHILVLLIRLAMIVAVYFGLRWIIPILTARQVENSFFNSFFSKNLDRITNGGALVLWNCFKEYLENLLRLANYRSCFLGMATTMFIILQILQWKFGRTEDDDDF